MLENLNFLAGKSPKFFKNAQKFEISGPHRYRFLQKCSEIRIFWPKRVQNSLKMSPKFEKFKLSGPQRSKIDKKKDKI